MDQRSTHALELDRFAPEGYERLKLLSACLIQQAAGSNRALRGCDARSDRHCGKAFSPLAQPHSQLDKVPHRSLLVSTAANQNERPLLALTPKADMAQ